MHDLTQRPSSEATPSAVDDSPGKHARTARIARKGGGAIGAGAEAALAQTEGSSGTALPDGPRATFEASLGTDLSAVRLHTDGASAGAAAELGARAFTVGNDVHFGAGQYQPSDPFGMHLLGHEVAHTVQQRGGGGGPQAKLEVSEPGDALEVEADVAATAMVRGEPTTVSSAAVGAARMIHRFGLGEGGGGGSPAAGGPAVASQPPSSSGGAPAPAPGQAAHGGGGGGMLAVGARGAEVEELQRKLTAAGHACAVDGQFGPGTRAAVVAFQRAHGLAADGVVGPMTRAALGAAPSAPAAGPAPAGAAAAAPGGSPATPATAPGASPAAAAGPAPAATPAAAGAHAVAPDAPIENPADKAIANPTRQAIVAAARSKIGSVESNTPAEPDETGDRTRKGWAQLTEFFDVAYPEFPKKIIKYMKWGKNSESPNGLVSWCGIFATWAIMTGGGSCGTWRSGDRCSSMKRLTTNPKPGDLGYFESYSHHCIIAAVDGDRIETIDGNAYDADTGGSGAITSRWRQRSDFQGFFKQVDD